MNELYRATIYYCQFGKNRMIDLPYNKSEYDMYMEIAKILIRFRDEIKSIHTVDVYVTKVSIDNDTWSEIKMNETSYSGKTQNVQEYICHLMLSVKYGE